MPETYPPTFPQALLSPYAWTVDTGLLRTPMDGGLARQRRLYTVMPHAFELSFVVPVEQLTAWQTWVNSYAFEYFEMNLLSWLSNGSCASPHYVRFTSGLAFGLITKGKISCKVTVELSPAQVSNYQPASHDAWIIAGIPDVPSADTVTAGIPDIPAPDMIDAGEPNAPS